METARERRPPPPFVKVAHTRKAPWAGLEAVFASLQSEEGLAWLDSGMRLGRTGRWSYIAFAPFAVIRPADGRFTLSGRTAPRASGDPFRLMEDALSAFRIHDAAVDEGSPPFKGGAIGFLGYGLSRFVEPSAAVGRRAAREGDIWLGLYDRLIAFDHDTGEASLVVCVEEGEDPGPAFCALEEVMSAASALAPSPPAVSPAASAPASDFSKEEYMAAVRRVREYIEQGDCCQVNISQRFQAISPDDPKDVYMRLRSISPAPYAAYIDTGEARILSSSPECFLTLGGGGRVTTRPIKGTRRRGRTPEEDARLSRELAESEKERAENIMIVDLLRNDLSKVCLPNTVRVPALCEVEKFPTVLHLTSTVEGRLRPGLGAVDLLRAAFPGGSVTGAPKIRAMEIIDEIEPVPRGVYCGAIGWIGFGGGMDMSVAIRVMAERGGLYTFHAGGGVTYPSDPAAEYQETLDKAAAMARALG